jgi:hypothetical protein
MGNPFKKRLDALSKNKPYVKSKGKKLIPSQISPTDTLFKTDTLLKDRKYKYKQRISNVTNTPTTTRPQMRLYRQ